MSDNTDSGIEDPGGQGRPAPSVGARLVRIVSIVLAVVLVLAAGGSRLDGAEDPLADDQDKRTGRAP